MPSSYPRFWEQNAARLREIGFHSDSLTLPLSQIYSPVSDATRAGADAPAFCGEVEIVARGPGARGLFVVRAASGAAYYGQINYDLFFVGDELTKGHLWAAENFFFLTTPEQPLDAIKQAMRHIPVSRDLYTRSVGEGANSVHVQILRIPDAPNPAAD